MEVAADTLQVVSSIDLISDQSSLLTSRYVRESRILDLVWNGEEVIAAHADNRITAYSFE